MTDSAAAQNSAPKPMGLALASLVFGVVAGLMSLLPVAGALVGVAAVVLGIVAIRKGQSKVLAGIGIALGVIGFVISLFFTIAWIGLGAATGTA
jgi:hypothetical protein